MSFNSWHMQQLIQGVRGSVKEVNVNIVPNDYPAGFQGVKELTLREIIAHMDSWEEYIKYITSMHEYGNTKYNDLNIISHFYRSALNLTLCARAIGYSIGTGSSHVCTISLTSRLRRMNMYNPAVVIEPLIEKGWITRETIQHILIRPSSLGRGEAKKRDGMFYKFYAKWYVVGVLDVYEGNVQNTAAHIGVGEDVIVQWRDMEVEQVLLEGGRKI